jgi:predicted nucleic acid-binding Zn ribbon protein
VCADQVPGDRVPGDGSAAEQLPGDQPRSDATAGVGHEDTGLDLARSVARALARPSARRGGAGSRRTAGKDPADPRGAGRVGRPQVSGAHPDERDPQLLEATIGRLIDDQGWSTDVRVHGVFSRWESLVGREVAAHCRPEAFAESRLAVRTDSTAWATQLRLLAPMLVRRLNEQLGDGTIRVIEVLGPRGPSWKRGPRSVRGGRGPRDTYG